MARIVAKASAVAGLDWQVWHVATTLMHDDTMRQGCHAAELCEHNDNPTCTLNSTKAYISSMRAQPANTLHSDILSEPI